jgi:hypothetical protein
VNIQGRFTATESALLNATSGAGSRLAERLVDATGTFIGGMTAAGYAVTVDGRVPDQLRDHVMAKAVWEWLRDFPSLKIFKTAERLAAYQEAEKVYLLIVKKEYGALEPPGGMDTTACWNSENKIIGRMHPAPPPNMQFVATGINGPAYANPNAMPDAMQFKLPIAPVNLIATAGAGQVTLGWFAPDNASAFNVYRGTASGAESLVFPNFTGGSYIDTRLTVGVAYFYQVSAVNFVGEGPRSLETNATPT